MRVAQMVVAQYTQFTWDTVNDLDDTSRGEGGFGSTGKH
jgi:dUTP pyrophosphatase